ncbi:MAG TPA: hypothetical protein VIT67_14445 [Povalibacter sp.]
MHFRLVGVAGEQSYKQGMVDTTLTGIVVTHEPGNDLGIVPSHGGLYLLTDEGRMISLVRHAMYVQMSVDQLRLRSRASFEALLGQRVTVQGYLSGRTLYSATVMAPASHDQTVDPYSY